MLYELLNNIIPELPQGTVKTYLNLKPKVEKIEVRQGSKHAQNALIIREAIFAAIQDENDSLALISEETGISVTTVKNYVKKMQKEGIVEIQHVNRPLGGRSWQITAC